MRVQGQGQAGRDVVDRWVISTGHLIRFFCIASVTTWLKLRGEADSAALGAKKIDLIHMSFKTHGFDLGR